MNIDNQKEYWDKVANTKNFTHPLNNSLLTKHLNAQSKILDFGCGYGRITAQLIDLGFQNVTGFDTSKELIQRGRSNHDLPIFHINDPLNLPVPDESVDCILLFAVLTCIPSNKGQQDLVDLLYTKLKKGGFIYISDYHLQENSGEVKQYTYLNDDKENYGVFHLAEGATFRHHTREWVAELTEDFILIEENEIDVMTMNKHSAKGFQLFGQK